MRAITRNGIVALLAAYLTINAVHAQIQWTPEQKAVWKTETAITDAWIKGDQQTANSYYDDSYQGWPMRSPIPIPKTNMDAASAYYNSEGGKYLFWNAVPLVIWVKGDFAYTDYYYRSVFQDKDGKKTEEHGKWMDVLMKKDGKWLLVGDRGGADPAPAGK